MKYFFGVLALVLLAMSLVSLLVGAYLTAGALGIVACLFGICSHDYDEG